MNSPFFENPLTLFLTGLGLLILFFLYFATGKERRRRNIGTTLLVGVCGLRILAVVPANERLKGDRYPRYPFTGVLTSIIVGSKNKNVGNSPS